MSEDPSRVAPSSSPNTALEGVLAFPAALGRASAEIEGHHVEVHLSESDDRAARAVRDLAAFAHGAPGAVDAFLRLAIGADLLVDRLRDGGVETVAVAIGAVLVPGVQSASGAFTVEDGRSTFVVVAGRDENRVATCTVWTTGEGDERTALTVSCDGAAASLEAARAAIAAPERARSILVGAGADAVTVDAAGRVSRRPD